MAHYDELRQALAERQRQEQIERERYWAAQKEAIRLEKKEVSVLDEIAGIKKDVELIKCLLFKKGILNEDIK